MGTKVLMITSAFFMAVLGIAATFMPREILSYFNARPDWFSLAAVQTAGALYLGFAILNWTARRNIIGGIYSKPISLGNFLHFVAAGLSLLKKMTTGGTGIIFIIITILYLIFAVWFGLVTFTHPAKASAG